MYYIPSYCNPSDGIVDTSTNQIVLLIFLQVLPRIPEEEILISGVRGDSDKNTSDEIACRSSSNY